MLKSTDTSEFNGGWPGRHVCVGDRIRYIGSPPGEYSFGIGDPVRWLRGGDEGAVTEIIRGFARHRCPDHGDGTDDCVCGSDGWVDACPAAPVVAFEGREGIVERCIGPDDEGTGWERVTN